MKDRLGQNRWWNMPMRNPVQTSYRRFKKVPWGEIKTPFTESVNKFNKFNKDKLKTIYSEFLEK